MGKLIASFGAAHSAGWVIYLILEKSATWGVALHTAFLVLFLSLLFGRD